MPNKKVRRGSHRRRVSGTKGGSRVRTPASPHNRKRRVPATKRKSGTRRKNQPLHPSKAAPKKRRRAPRSSIEKRMRETEDALDILGEENIKRRSIVLGQTRWLTPTRRGFDALSRVLETVVQLSKGKHQTFTYDLDITFRGADGSPVAFSRPGVGIPRMQDIRREVKETLTAALERTVERRIRIELWGVIRQTLGGYQVATQTARGRKRSKKAVISDLRRLKRTRDIRFRVTFRREISSRAVRVR